MRKTWGRIRNLDPDQHQNEKSTPDAQHRKNQNQIFNSLWPPGLFLPIPVRRWWFLCQIGTSTFSRPKENTWGGLVCWVFWFLGGFFLLPALPLVVTLGGHKISAEKPKIIKLLTWKKKYEYNLIKKMEGRKWEERYRRKSQVPFVSLFI